MKNPYHAIAANFLARAEVARAAGHASDDLFAAAASYAAIAVLQDLALAAMRAAGVAP